jgi:NTE family protein
MGVTGQGRDARGAALASYLLFEAPYTRALMALGEADAMTRRDEVVAFFGWRAARREFQGVDERSALAGTPTNVAAAS